MMRAIMITAALSASACAASAPKPQPQVSYVIPTDDIDAAADQETLVFRLLGKMHLICGWYGRAALTSDNPVKDYRECVDRLSVNPGGEDRQAIETAFRVAKARM